jgi:hypothetical protein
MMEIFELFQCSWQSRSATVSPKLIEMCYPFGRRRAQAQVLM